MNAIRLIDKLLDDLNRMGNKIPSGRKNLWKEDDSAEIEKQSQSVKSPNHVLFFALTKFPSFHLSFKIVRILPTLSFQNLPKKHRG